ncbi:MAG: lamin tail domain-containing protein [Candidatus Sungbacteria bacterium]|nr:lamin tail domain-containing protein [Candidatus Sungbacteria bacterium]
MRSAWLYVLLALAVLALAQSALASVVISEVAWMGTGVSTADEWVELKNDAGSPVDLSGWRLEWRGGEYGLTINSDKCANTVLSAGGYFLLERTNDDTVPNVAADCIYTGALSNSGEVLILKNDIGAAVDQVDASAGWPAGDNTTKETMQRVSSGWITAVSTPRAANASDENSESAPPDDSPQDLPSEEVAVSSGVTPLPSLKAYAGKDRTAVQGSLVEFRGSADGINGEPLISARFSWNFGDGTTKEGKIVSHVYYFPGSYTASLNVSSGEYAGADYIKITVVSPNIIISEAKSGERGFLEVYNGTAYRLDLGGFRFESGDSAFVIQKDTFIEPKSALVFPNAVTNLFQNGSYIVLKNALEEIIDYGDFKEPLLMEESFTRASGGGQKFVKTKSLTPGVYIVPGPAVLVPNTAVVLPESVSAEGRQGKLSLESDVPVDGRDSLLVAPVIDDKDSNGVGPGYQQESSSLKEAASPLASGGFSPLWFFAVAAAIGVIVAAGFLFLRI